MIKRFFSLSTAVIAVSLGLGLASGGVLAAACQTPASGSDPLVAGSPGTVSTAGMGFRGSDADACAALYDGNNTLAEVNTIASNLGWGGPFNATELKAETGSNPDAATVFGIQWTLSTDLTPSGDWTLSFQAEPDVTRTLDVVGVLKASQGWAAFLFDDEVFTTDGSGAGTFTVQWCPGNPPTFTGCNNFAGLSHLQIYFAETDQVPEPGTVALLGLALAVLSVANRRRRMARA
ncbi:MAG: PEP-CTERM sorting domain-containing protein [Longimicrobiales bacterium]